MKVELDLKKIKSNDLEAIANSIGSVEILTAQRLSKILDKYIESDWGTCAEYIKMVYLFKLGLMIDKREERARKKKINTKVSQWR